MNQNQYGLYSQGEHKRKRVRRHEVNITNSKFAWISDTRKRCVLDRIGRSTPNREQPAKIFLAPAGKRCVIEDALDSARWISSFYYVWRSPSKNFFILRLPYTQTERWDASEGNPPSVDLRVAFTSFGFKKPIPAVSADTGNARKNHKTKPTCEESRLADGCSEWTEGRLVEYYNHLTVSYQVIVSAAAEFM